MSPLDRAPAAAHTSVRHILQLPRAIPAFLCFLTVVSTALAQTATREHDLLDLGWKFNLGELSGVDPYAAGLAIPSWKYLIDANGPSDAGTYAATSFNDSSWASVNTNTDIFNGSLTYAWMRVHLDSLASQSSGHRWVVFESVDDIATVYLNGKRIQNNTAWNQPFAVNLDSAWVNGGPNVLAVLVQNTGGSGGIMKRAGLVVGANSSMAVGTTGYNDSSWKSVNLPHDYVVQGTFTSSAATDHGSLPLTPAWYRRSFTVPAADQGKNVQLSFEGVYRNATVYVNGSFVALQRSGYVGFDCDITPYVNFSGTNEIAVHTDPTVTEGWFYEGGGIYRHVWLDYVDPVHVAPNGIWVNPSVSGTSAATSVATTVVNTASSAQSCTVISNIYDPSGALAASVQSTQSIPASGSATINQSTTVSNAKLWSLATPNLYSLQTTVQHGSSNDIVTTPFGIRTLRFDINNGFFLNGQHVELQGTANHQDFMGVGAGLPDSLFEYRLQQLQAMGCNAIRTAHNPVAPALLDLCDRMGILVMDENRHLADTYAQKTGSGIPSTDLFDLKYMIQRDRNHPSVILWSMCNEEGLQTSSEGQSMLLAMKNAVKALDTTRPVTAAQNGFSSAGSPGFMNVVDVIGMNYDWGGYGSVHSGFPNTPMFGSETSSEVGTRGVYSTATFTESGTTYTGDLGNQWCNAYDVNAPPWGGHAEPAWQNIGGHAYMAGSFTWTGFDYLGEPTPFGWPSISSQFGILDRCGFPKDNFYFYQSVWTTSPMVHVFPHWNWSSGQTVNVWAFSNCQQVEVFLNGASQGVKSVPVDGHVEWNIPFASGSLLAKGYNSGATVAQDLVQTAGAPASIVLGANKRGLLGDGEDTAVVNVSVVDINGVVVPTANNQISFSLSGAGHLAGVGSGNSSSHEPEQAAQRLAFNGLCAALVQSNSGGSGTVTITASASGLGSASLSFALGQSDVNWVETESASVVGSTAGIANRIVTAPQFSGGAGSILDATAAGNYIAYLVPNVSAGSYDVRIGVKAFNSRGIVQLAIGQAGNPSPANLGAPQDLYSASANFTELDLGTWTPATTSDKWFRFTITGKNASSSGYSECIDYIRLIPTN